MTIKLRTVTRAGLRDIWNAFMVKGAAFSKNGIPFCPNTTSQIPESLITYDEAVQIYNQELRRKNRYFHSQSFVCFFIDDYKFDNPSGIWFRWKLAQKILEHFEGIITPDFSTYQDFPLPLKLFATYKMRTFGYWWGSLGHKVINNVRGDMLSLDFCFDGIPQNGTVCIGTVASGLRQKINRDLFSLWLEKMIEVLKPQLIIVYGSCKYECFEKARRKGIKIISYPSKISLAFQLKMSKTSSGLFNTYPLSPIAKKAFIQELRNRGEKFNEEKIVFITKDATGQIIWLEKGNNLAGLEHIMQRHEKDFKKALGIDKEQIPNFLENIITHGEIISNEIVSKKGHECFERKYKYNGKYYILTGIGSNGFVVSAYPTTK